MTAEQHYRFAVISDIHIDLENGGNNTYFINAEQNFVRALRVIRERGCDFVVSAGDQVTNASGADAEWRRYRALIAASGYDGMILEAMGNHETRFARYGGCTLCDCHAEFLRYTRLAEKPVSLPAGKTYYEYLHPLFGDSFVFMSLENGVSTNELDNFSDEQMDWAEDLIALRISEGRRVFLIQHAPLYGFGAGDRRDSPAYAGSIRLSDREGRPFRNNCRFKALIERYPRMIWLSGHTHVDLSDNLNCSTDDGRACHMLHIPALAGTTHIRKNGRGYTLDRTFHPDSGQGYLADVYADRAVFRGINLCTDTVYPQYTYTIPR